MTASEHGSQPRQQSAQSAQPTTLKPAAPSMSDLLASCAAASAVSTPPREEHLAQEPVPRRDAA
ncbi:hypothetical protein [Streptomyces sp. NPDC005283]|uniref:hypothetical protein n=1 Tax=unclassified Streptomyces TaxID=2593676 RepID=UPI003451BB3F